MNKFYQKNVLAQSVAGLMMIFSLLGCNRSNTITAFRGNEIPETEYWQVESVVNGHRLTVKEGFRQRTLQLCGIDENSLTPQAKIYLQEQINKSPETVPTIFAGKDKKGIWCGDIWVGRGDEENSAARESPLRLGYKTERESLEEMWG